MQAGRRQAYQQVAVFYAAAVYKPGALYYSHRKTGQVVFILPVKSGHFCRFTANQGTACLNAALAYTFDQSFHQSRFQLAQSDIVQKKQRLGAVGHNIVDAHGYQVYTYTIMYPHHLSNFKLGSYPIRTGNQYRFLIL